jgi:hypothetical protein
MNCYYTQNHIDSFIEITDKVACNAYYYPVLKELLATHKAAPFLQTPGYSFDDVYDIVNDMCKEQNLSTEERNFWITCFAKTVLVK